MRRALIAIAVAMAFACDQQTPPAAPPSGLWSTAWRLEDLGGLGVVDGAEATLEFPAEGKAAGHATCNRFFATVTVTGTAIRFSEIGATRMACAEPLASQETNYLKALEVAESFVVEGDTLSIQSRDLPAPLLFSRATPEPSSSP
jgi:heat shock protein HslJ